MTNVVFSINKSCTQLSSKIKNSKKISVAVVLYSMFYRIEGKGTVHIAHGGWTNLHASTSFLFVTQNNTMKRDMNNQMIP